jgi:hypothetical protein
MPDLIQMIVIPSGKYEAGGCRTAINLDDDFSSCTRRKPTKKIK